VNSETIKHLADEVLTFIEQREAEQIAYGIYDLTLTGSEVIRSFQPSDDIQLPPEARTSAITQALEQLAINLQIIRFDQEELPENWVFRSRVAETVRLLTKLRQRIVNHNPGKAAHRISKSKRLIEDVKFSVASRRVPRRNIPVRTCMGPLLAGNSEQQQTADLLLTVIEQTLTKLQQMSGFQRRTLRAILQAIELEPQQSIERGVVVTASTGAGKTYAFFLPVLAKMVLERCLRQRVGVKAICIYPRVALSENQLTDFIEVLYHLNQVLVANNLPAITIGVESGAAVYQIKDFQKIDESQQKKLAKQRGWTFSEEHQGYLSPFAYCVGTEGHSCDTKPQRLLSRPTQPELLVCPECSKAYPFIKFARDVMKKEPPDLLIATTESLHRRLISSEYQYLFGNATFCAPSVVMLDEIHLQTSTSGTQVALLLRRLLARIRMGKRDREEPANLAFVGLSATIAHPKQFLSELSGIDPVRIEEVKPQDHEMQIIGAERFIFARAEDTEDTAVLSSLIQTAMCVLHTMPQPATDGDLKRYRTFGFVQSLDIVGRWLYQMQDAEKVKDYQAERRQELKGQGVRPTDDTYPIRYVPLYAYRYPPLNRQLFPNFFGPTTQYNCNCERTQTPNPNCPLFQAGECWWVLSQKGKARQEPLNIKRKSGSDRSVVIEDDDDLVITTSALEVGYDDEALMCVIQYTAPANIASFVQRKGRGGRKVGTRPIVVTVLSPYKPTDLFLFRNEHLLTDPTFQKLPLNAQNRYLQRIHGFYALFDWLTYQAHLVGIELDLEKLSRQGYQYLLNQTVNMNMMLKFKDYLKESFAIADSNTLIRVLGDVDSDGFLWSIFFEGLMKAVHPKFDRENEQTVKARPMLTQHLPENLFSDINLPEVRVDYRPDDRRFDKRLDPESISLAISETIPGNVTFRGGEGSTWIPPVTPDGQSLIPLSRYYTSKDRIENSPSTVNLPKRALKLVGITPRSDKFLTLYRPTQIEPQQFSRDYNSSFWYCKPDTGELRECRRTEDAPQDMYQLAHSCSAQSISAVYIRPIRDVATSKYTFKPTDQPVACDSLGQNLVQDIVLYSDEPDNLNLLDVRRIILGSQYTLKFHEAKAEDIRQVVGFTADEDANTNCALGYQLITEGISINLNPDALSTSIFSPSTKATLRNNAVRHAFITNLTVESGESYFAAENLVNVLLSLADNWCHEQAGTPDGLRNWLVAGNNEFNRQFTQSVNQIHQLSPKKTEAVMQLVASPNDYLSIFLDLYEEFRSEGALYQDYLQDTFQYSLTVALKQVAQEIAGVEALNYVSAWTRLRIDFGNEVIKPIWLYEIGMGGIGVMRATQDLLRKNPDRFWTTLAHRMTRCPTAQEEAFLRYLLAQPQDWLAHCEALVNAVIQARSSSDRQIAIEGLLVAVRKQLQVIVQQKQLKALLRVFIPDYTQQVDGNRLINWRIFREINQDFLPSCTQQFGRDPSFTEAKSILYRTVASSLNLSDQALPYPELARLLQLYRIEYGTAENEVRRAFESAIERRMLMTCRCSCPNCLDERSGDIEAPGLSRNLLNRPLLTEWLTQAHASQTLTLEGENDDTAITSIGEQIRHLLEKGYQAIYLRVPSDRLSSLCTTISYLTDAGIDTDLGMIYPMITDIQTVYPTDLTVSQSPAIEITIRPIE
jgi:hypothetical protein